MPSTYSETKIQHAENSGRHYITNSVYQPITFTRKFQFTDCNHPSVNLSFPYFPNEEIFENQLMMEHLALRFVLKKNGTVVNNPSHILSQLINTKFPVECDSTTCFILHINENTLSVLVKRLQDIIFANVYTINGPVEVVYIVQYLIQALNASPEIDKFYFAGQIREESQIVNTSKIYFRKVSMLQMEI